MVVQTKAPSPQKIFLNVHCGFVQRSKDSRNSFLSGILFNDISKLTRRYIPSINRLSPVLFIKKTDNGSSRNFVASYCSFSSENDKEHVQKS